MPTLRLSLEVSEECLSFILTTIFEQGVGYWVRGYSAHGTGWREKARANDEIVCRYMAPAYGGHLVVQTVEGESHLLTQRKLLAGIARAAGEGRFKLDSTDDMAGEIDCEIADVILQYAILGEIRFG